MDPFTRANGIEIERQALGKWFMMTLEMSIMVHGLKIKLTVKGDISMLRLGPSMKETGSMTCKTASVSSAGLMALSTWALSRKG
jgi:hypothetical protein